MYLLLKLLHVIFVILFLGNITTGLFWHKHAARTRDPKLLFHTMDGIIRSDRLFTTPGVLGILAAGVALAIYGNFPMLGTGWILWTLVLFAISGAAWHDSAGQRKAWQAWQGKSGPGAARLVFAWRGGACPGQVGRGWRGGAMLVSPAEPLLLRRIGKVSSIPERYGADFFWCSGGKKHAVQRKTPADFVASVVDGRLHRELLQLRQVDGIRALVVEGPWIWAETGVWMGASRWDRLSYRQSIFTLMAEGVWIVSSESISDTIEVISELERWSQKPRHSFGRARANAVGQWGSPTSREYAIHLLQGLSGVGPELAERIFERFGIPWRWTVTAADLMQVEGIGRVKAEAMIDRLPPPDPPAEPVTPDPSLLIDRAQVKKPRRRKTPEEKKCAS